MVSMYRALQAIHNRFSEEAVVFIHDEAGQTMTAENTLNLNASLSMQYGAG
jgi:hypothetical protein